MATPGMRMTAEKRLALANCNGLLSHVSTKLDDLMARGRHAGLDIYQVEEVGPLTTQVVNLRRRRRRLEAELRAIAGEWAI